MKRLLPWLLAVAAVPALADGPRTWFRASGMAATLHTVSRDTDFNEQLTGNATRYEDELGLPRHGTVVGLGFGRRIGRAWRVEIDWWDDRRHGSTVLAADTEVGGLNWAAGSRLQTKLRLRQLRVDGAYALLQREDIEAGVLLGGQFLALLRRVDGTRVEGFGDFQDTSDSAPMPIVGAFGEGRFTEQFGWNARAEFALGTRFRSLGGDLLWRPHPMWSLGLGYRWLQADVDIRWGLVAGVERFVLDYRQHGPRAFVQFAF